MNQPDPTQGRRPRTLGVVGGGTAGYLTALAVKRRFPEIDVCVVSSSAVPVIGVGEATTTLMPPFLHAQLGLDIVEFFAAVRPTFKLGIKFEWGVPGDYSFTYPFGDVDPLAAQVHDGHLRDQSLVSMLMVEDRAPVLAGPEGQHVSLLPQLKFAYHLDNAPFVAFLEGAARRAGIGHVDAMITDVVTGERGVETACAGSSPSTTALTGAATVPSGAPPGPRSTCPGSRTSSNGTRARARGCAPTTAPSRSVSQPSPSVSAGSWSCFWASRSRARRRG